MSDPFRQPPVGVPPPPGPAQWGPAPSNGLATAAMVLGIIAVLPAITIIFAFLAVVPGILAIGLGIGGLAKANRHPAQPGRGQAISGIVLGVLTLIALVVEIVLFAVVLDSVDVEFEDRRVAEVDDYTISDRTCAVRDDLAVAGGVLTNRSGAPHAFFIDVRFLDGGRRLGVRTDRIESPLDDGEKWTWEVVLPLEAGRGVDTDGLDCRIVQIELATVVTD